MARENSGRCLRAPAVPFWSASVSDAQPHKSSARSSRSFRLRPVEAGLFPRVVTPHRISYCDDFSVCCSVAYAQSGPGFPLVPLHRRQCKTRSAAHLFRANVESIVSRQAIDASKHRWHQARKSAIGAPERRGYAQKGSKQNDSSAAWSSASWWCNRLSETI